MSLTQIVKARKGKAGSGNAWQVKRSALQYDEAGTPVYELWHYATVMLVWADLPHGAVALIDYSTGHGSVSDQNGMNQAFRALGLNLYFSRRSGASIN